MIEYALMLGFLAVAAGAILPGAASSIGTIFSQVGSVMNAADVIGSDALKQQQLIEVLCGADGEPPQTYRPTRACDNLSLR
ncbi:MAG: hypothetical protein M3O20_03390 [Acidobacteriota bacterium]|nr:hypothetical protein [Acidobacteriota bacterium]